MEFLTSLSVNTIQSDLYSQYNPYQNPNNVFAEIQNSTLRFIYNLKGSQTTKTIL